MRSLVTVGLLPKALLGQQTANPAPPPPAPVPWTLGLIPWTPLAVTETANKVAKGKASFFTVTQKAVLSQLREGSAAIRQCVQISE